VAGLFVFALVCIVCVVPIRRGYTPRYNSPESIASLEQLWLPVRLFSSLAAPIKRMVWFEHSAHFVFFEEPKQFALEMKRVAAETSRWESEQSRH
jgi:hypothetical protein